MQIRKNALPIISCVLIILLSLFNITVSFIFSPESAFESPVQAVLAVLILIIAVIGTSFVKEEHLNKIAIPIYIAVNALLAVQLIFEQNEIYMGFELTIAVASLLPLLSLEMSKAIDKYSQTKKYIPYMLALIPMGLTLFQKAIAPAIIYFIVFTAVLIIFRCERKVRASRRIFVFVVVLILLFAFKLYLNYASFYDLVNVCLTRGKCDAQGEGYIRVVLDDIFSSSKLIGGTDFSVNGIAIENTIADWGLHKIVIVLTKFGWIPFVITLLCYVIFLISIFKMSVKTNQSYFARNVSLFLSLSIASQTLVSLVSLFFFYRSLLNLPFFGSYIINCINYISYIIILNLYLRRNKSSVIYKVNKDNTSDKTICLVNEDRGEQYQLELLDYLCYRKQFYVCLKKSSEDKSGKIVIMKIEKEDESDSFLDLKNMLFVRVNDDNTLKNVFNLFKKKNEREYNFTDWKGSNVL